MDTSNTAQINVYLQHYSKQEEIPRYISKTAGAGIGHVLNEIYAPIYERVLRKRIAQCPKDHRFRVLEYGCGGGMNLLKIVQVLESLGTGLEKAYGTDFAGPMIEAAQREASENLSPALNSKVRYLVAGNQTLAADLAAGLRLSRKDLAGTFDLVVGVNTFRYCHRLRKETECAADIFNLLSPGGYSIMIDMNGYFPFFRSRFTPKRWFAPKGLYRLPTLEEYARPFQKVGFQIEEMKNLCWIPHSAGPAMLGALRRLSPILDPWFSKFAMRCLVVGRKPV